jgi:periplasmic copper chaperone A
LTSIKRGGRGDATVKMAHIRTPRLRYVDSKEPMPSPFAPSFRRAALALAAATFALPAAAQVAVSDAWVRGTVAGQSATGAFMQLKSPADTALVSAASPVAKIVEIHEMKMDAGVMKMNAIDALAIPAGKAVELKPGGYHVMLMGLAAPLKEGETVPVTLTFKAKDGKTQTVEVKAPVRALTAAAKAPAPDAAHKH